MSLPVRPWAVEPLHVLTGAEAGAFDAWAIRERQVPQPALMERAGTGAAQLLDLLHPQGTVRVLVGKGNNGGDALVLARCLAAWGRSVQVVVLPGRQGPDPLLHDWAVPTHVSDDLSGSRLAEILGEGDLLVDGILGTGISGPARGEADRLIQAVNAAAPPVLALDIPSGIEADTGSAPGHAVRAATTVSLGWPKLGTLLHPGREHAGRLLALEIGFPPLPPGSASARLLTPAWAVKHRPRRSPVTHKNRVGALAVVAGRSGMAGAAVLAGRSALRSGAGYVRVVTHPDNREIVQTALPEAVFVDASDLGAVKEALQASRAVAAGPGMGTGEDGARLLGRILEAGVPRILDADALTLLAGAPELRSELGGVDTVITPHPGEAARLLDLTVEEIQEDRLGALRELRERTGAVALLKGTPSLVSGGDVVWIDATGSSDLAVAGMGDTLTGAVGSFLAQGVSGLEAAGLGLLTTGRAAALADRGAGLQSGDVPEYIPRALAEGAGEPGFVFPGLLLDLDPPR